MQYQSQSFDETFDREGQPRPACREFLSRIEEIGIEELRRRQDAAELQLQNTGITFNVYGHEEGVEKVWPFDAMPRILDSEEWSRVDAGLRQRVSALNLFIDDVYNDQRIISDGVIPSELLHTSKTYRPELRGFSPTHQAWCHVSGVDLVRDSNGELYVLEDNLRCPSGVSYVLENRDVMKRAFSQVFHGVSIAPVEEYP